MSVHAIRMQTVFFRRMHAFRVQHPTEDQLQHPRENIIALAAKLCTGASCELHDQVHVLARGLNPSSFDSDDVSACNDLICCVCHRLNDL